MQKSDKFLPKAVLYVMIAFSCSFALAGGAFLDMEMGNRIYIFELIIKTIIMVGIFAYASLLGMRMNTPESKFFTPWLLIALIPFIANTLDCSCIPDRVPDAVEVISMLLTVFTTAAWEEMLFRYVGRTMFERDEKYSIGAIILLALTFGSAHLINIFFEDPTSVLLKVAVASISGVFLLALYRHTGSLWLTITAHALQNLAASFFQMFPDAELLIPTDIVFILSKIAQLSIGIFILVKYKYVIRSVKDTGFTE